jgi:hypothetical protein
MGAFELFRGDALDAYRTWPALATITGVIPITAVIRTFYMFPPVVAELCGMPGAGHPWFPGHGCSG